MSEDKKEKCNHSKVEKPCKCGRPSSYDRKFIKSVDKYLEANQDEEVEVVKQRGAGGKYEMLETKLTVKLPTHEGFAMYIGVNPTTLYEWEKKHPQFSKSLRKIKTEQQQRLLNKGLSGLYNPTIAKLILSSKLSTSINFW